MWLRRAWPAAHPPFLGLGYFWEEGAALFCVHNPVQSSRLLLNSPSLHSGQGKLDPRLAEVAVTAPSRAEGRTEPRLEFSLVPADSSHIFHCCSPCPALSSEAPSTDLPDLTSPLTFCWAASVNQTLLKTDEDTALGKRKTTKKIIKKPQPNQTHSSFQQGTTKLFLYPEQPILQHTRCAQ